LFDVRTALRRLSETLAPAGWEQNAAAAARELLEPFGGEVRTDAPGNVSAWFPAATPHAKTVLWDAHIDEVGFMVTGHDGGYLRFRALGGLDTRILPAQEICLLTEPPARAVVTCLPPHVLSEDDRDTAFPPDKLFLDAGLSPQEAPEKIPVGTVGCFAPRFAELAQNRFCGKALDDRCGFVTLLWALDMLRGKPLPVNLIVAATVREELGSLGAVGFAYGNPADAAIAVDVTFGDGPDSPRELTFPLGSGAAVGIGPILHRGFSDSLANYAEQQDLPHTRELMTGRTATDADAYQIARGGVPTAAVSIPLRYMHTPAEIVCLDDMETVAKLLSGWLLWEKGGKAL
jgi:endoglucanase